MTPHSYTHRLKPRKVKNESRNTMGDVVGRIHLGRQDLSSMRVKRVKALRRTRGGEDGDEGGGEGAGAEGMDVESDEGEGVYDSGDDDEGGSD